MRGHPSRREALSPPSAVPPREIASRPRQSGRRGEDFGQEDYRLRPLSSRAPSRTLGRRRPQLLPPQSASSSIFGNPKVTTSQPQRGLACLPLRLRVSARNFPTRARARNERRFAQNGASFCCHRRALRSGFAAAFRASRRQNREYCHRNVGPLFPELNAAPGQPTTYELSGSRASRQNAKILERQVVLWFASRGDMTKATTAFTWVDDHHVSRRCRQVPRPVPRHPAHRCDLPSAR